MDHPRSWIIRKLDPTIGRRPVLAGLLTGAAVTLTTTGASSAIRSVPTPRRAPQWDVSEWLNGDGRNVEALRGSVIVIDFFQLWCPGCISFSIPLMNQWEQDFATEVKAGKLAFVSIHTVFEGHGYQAPERLKRFIRKKKILHPVGIDRHVAGSHVPETMRRYRTRGTPEMAIIDTAGMIRLQKFGFFEPAMGEGLIHRLLTEAQGGTGAPYRT